MPTLNVPHRQQLDFGYCLPACVEMVLAHFGINRAQTEIAGQLGVIEGVGVPASRVARLGSAKLRVTRVMGELPDLLNALASDIPPIIEVRTSQLPYWNEDTFHVVVLVGVEGDASLLNDPAIERPITVSTADLLLAWDETDNHFTLIERR